MVGTYHSQLIKRPRTLNIPQRLLQILQLLINLPLRLLRTLHSLRLKSLNRLNLSIHIILLDLEVIELFLDIGDDVGVAEGVAVGGEVDGLGLLLEELDAAACVVVALFEVGEGVGCAAAEAEFGAEVVPVDF